MHLLLSPNDEDMVLLNPLTLDNFLHIQNGAIFLNPLSVRTSDNHERGGPAQTLEALPRPPKVTKLKERCRRGHPEPYKRSRSHPKP